MLFNFQSFIDEMREKDEKKEIVEKYENLYWPIQWDIEDQLWYKEYLTKFDFVPFLTPDELGNDFDWNLLQKLVTGSFSSDYELKFDESGDQSVVKTVSELWSFQMLRLYEIYIEEQMNLQILKKEDESEQWAIDSEREMRLKKRNAVRDTMGREQMAKEVKADQEEKLWDLLGKL